MRKGNMRKDARVKGVYGVPPRAQTPWHGLFNRCMQEEYQACMVGEGAGGGKLSVLATYSMSSTRNSPVPTAPTARAKCCAWATASTAGWPK